MADAEELLRRAVPRLAREDEGAAKLRAKLLSLARQVCKGGPEKAARRGLSLDARRLEKLSRLEGDALLEALHSHADERELLRLWKALMAELSEALKRKRAASACGDAALGGKASSSGKVSSSGQASSSGKVSAGGKTSSE